MIAANSSALILPLVLAVFFGATSFLVANTFRQSTGRSPWGIHPGVWLVIGFVFELLGFILCLVARFTTRDRPPGPDAPYPGRDWGQAPYGQPGPYGQPTGYGQPAGAWGAQAEPIPNYSPQPAVGFPESSAQAPTAPIGNPPAEWYADPSGKHTHRYWNGTTWTEHVADNGVASIDPVPPEALPSSGTTPVNPT